MVLAVSVIGGVVYGAGSDVIRENDRLVKRHVNI